MAGTLLAYDAAFPRAQLRSGARILNTPSTAELAEYPDLYPTPHEPLSIPMATTATGYCGMIASKARTMSPLDRLILFAHGVVANAAEGTRVVQVTTGIAMGSENLTQYNAHLLGAAKDHFARNALVELWVCDAAAAGESGGVSGNRLCAEIAKALKVTVKAAVQTQQYDTVAGTQQQTAEGGWQSTARFLPWEGPVVYFDRNGVRRTTDPRGSH